MTLDAKILDILFRRIPPEKLLSRINAGRPGGRETYGAGFCPTAAEYKSWYAAVAEAALGGYSQDEQELTYQQTERKPTWTYIAGWESRNPPFHLLANYGEKVLERRGDVVFCRFEKVLDWRDTYLCLGQDMLITAWYAARAHPYWEPPRYSWPAVIPVNSRTLDRILSNGIAENHYHLYGSAAVFALNWARLMTWPDLSEADGKWLEENLLQFHINRGMGDNSRPMRECLLYAAFIRDILFRYLKNENIHCGAELRRFDATFEGAGKRELYASVDILRYQYGMKFEQPGGGKPRCLDYAFTRQMAGELDQDSRILAGERWLLYHCFRSCFSGKFETETQWIFYLYLLLKSRFREEIIQVNRQTGFRNFQNYERRKYKLWDLPGDESGTGAYWNEALRTAIIAPLREQPVQSLELRLTPCGSPDENLENIYSIDRAGLFYRHRRNIPARTEIDWRMDALGKPRSFYVLHFIKEREDEQIPRYTCRQQALREKTREQAKAIVQALNRHAYLCRRIRGVDACSNEIGCRPEVFAVPFRILQSCPVWLYAEQNIRFRQEQPLLSASYHAGEDFLDIADGLRAIDEAVFFLNLRRGSRIGHALALGVDPERHYIKKHRYVILPKQDLLDNLVWLYFRSSELNITIEPVLKERIRESAEDLFTELYRKPLQFPERTGGNERFALRDYYRSWALRGDDPFYYQISEGSVNIRPRPGDEFEAFALNRWNLRKENLEHYRTHNHAAKNLYYFYHYSSKIKELGRETIQFPIEEDYIRLMGEMQRKIQDYICELGISIECNPSSNALIGTFDGYESHPVFQFYDLAPHRNSASMPLHVSLNTDDQGIFETSLSFEYAIVAAALISRHRSDGTRAYSNQEVEDYIRNLQRMGNEQIFSVIDRIERDTI